MQEVSKVICVRCPMGCYITVYKKNNEYIVRGNQCPLGKEYAIQEITNPMRIVCSTVKIENAIYPRLPVRTDKPVPKSKIFEIIRELKNVVVKAPVFRGQVIIKNVAGTNANIIAERTMNPIDKR